MKLRYVLSLFDGMSCGQIALKELGIIPERYYASEIDKYAIRQTLLNFPATIQLGDVTKWETWDIEWEKIDLILAGSPCQGFSFAGKKLAFDDPRSRLFFVFIDILRHIRKHNPDVKFLLENVNMKKQHMMIINQMTGVFPVNINSSLVSAQNRNRWYWTNIKTKMLGLFCEVYADIPQPEDEGIYLKDILETEVEERYYISQAVIDRMLRKKYSAPSINPEKAGTLNTKNNSGQMSLDSGTTFISANGEFQAQINSAGQSLDGKNNFNYIKIDIDGKVKQNQGKSSCFTAGGNSGGNHSDMDLICVAIRGRDECLTYRRTEYGKEIRKDYEAGKIVEKRCNIQQLEPRDDGKTNCLTSVQKDNLIAESPKNIVSGRFRAFKENAGFREIKSGKGGTLMACAREDGIGQDVCKIGAKIRRLTPSECAHLQTIPEWYRWGCSESQQYKMLGNGWTVKVIMHILKFLN